MAENLFANYNKANSLQPSAGEKGYPEAHGAIVARPHIQTIQYTGVNDVLVHQSVTVIEVGITSIDHAKQLVRADSDNEGLVSLDALFSPYIINIEGSGHPYLPYWETPTELSDINSYKLNPFNPGRIFASGIATLDSEVYYNEGTTIGLQNRYPTGVLEGDIAGHTSPILDFYSNRLSFDNIRAVGFKAPVVLTGWGYTTDGQPVPASSGDPDVFASGAFRNPTLWKTGPLDVRWDDERKVWGSPPTKLYLVKMTNQYNPSCFSFEVDRATTRAQYTRNAPSGQRDFDATGVIYDPEYVAYNANPLNIGCYEDLDYEGIEYPYYEAFIIRKTNEDTSVTDADYNIWFEDCNDCGHVTNPCTSMTRHGSASSKKKVLIENPLRQSFDTGDLAFTVDTGKKKRVSGSTFGGGSGSGGTAHFLIDGGGALSFVLDTAGSGYTSGAFAVYSRPCVGLTLTTSAGAISSGSISGTTTGYATTGIFPMTIYPKNASASYEMLPIHWVLQAEFKAKQFITHVECDNGILQTCSIKGQLQGFSSCEQCGEDSSLINSFI